MKWQAVLQALQAPDAQLYNAALGYDDPEAREFPLYDGPLLEIKALVVQGNRAHIVNVYEGDVYLQHVNRRRVIQPKAWSLLGRDLRKR